MKIIKQGTSEHQKLLDEREQDVLKKELSDIQRLKKTLQSGRGQEQSAIDKIIDLFEDFQQRLQKLENRT